MNNPNLLLHNKLCVFDILNDNKVKDGAHQLWHYFSNKL